MDQYTLVIRDDELNKEYEQKRYPEINKMSLMIAYSRIVYGFIIMLQSLYVNGICILRPTIYMAFTLVHIFFIRFCQKVPTLQKFHSTVISLSYASFVLNSTEIYSRRSEHISLIIGYISLVYLASTFVSSKWIISSIGQMLSTIIVTHYYSYHFDYEPVIILPAMTLIVLTSICYSYTIELKEKQQFLD